jgi:hypothetical protein
MVRAKLAVIAPEVKQSRIALVHAGWQATPVSKFLRFRRGKRLKRLRELARLPFAERMKRLKPQPKKAKWWAIVAAFAVIGGVMGWVLT